MTGPRGFFITGTGTGVGKTVAAVILAAVLKRHGLDVGVMKPFETGVDNVTGSLAGSDAGALARVAGVPDEPEFICPIRLREPAAPMVAAEAEGRIIDLEAVLHAYKELARRHEFMLVEGAGGLAVPISSGYLMADLARDLGLPLIIVSPLALGAINHTVLTVHYARAAGLVVRGIILNSVQPVTGSLAEQTNAEVITSLTGVPILGLVPHLPGLDNEHDMEKLIRAADESITWNDLAGPLQTVGLASRSRVLSGNH